MLTLKFDSLSQSTKTVSNTNIEPEPESEPMYESESEPESEPESVSLLEFESAPKSSSEAIPPSPDRPYSSSHPCAGGDCLNCKGICEQCKVHKANLHRLHQLEADKHQLEADKRQLEADRRQLEKQKKKLLAYNPVRLTILVVYTLLDYAKKHLDSSERPILKQIKLFILDTCDLSFVPSFLSKRVHEMDVLEEKSDTNGKIEVHGCSHVHMHTHIYHS